MKIGVMQSAATRKMAVIGYIYNMPVLFSPLSVIDMSWQSLEKRQKKNIRAQSQASEDRGRTNAGRCYA